MFDPVEELISALHSFGYLYS